MRSMVMPRRNHQTESLERLKRAFGLANGTPMPERVAAGAALMADQPVAVEHGMDGREPMCESAWNKDPLLECAPAGGQNQAAVLTVCRAC